MGEFFARSGPMLQIDWQVFELSNQLIGLLPEQPRCLANTDGYVNTVGLRPGYRRQTALETGSGKNGISGLAPRSICNNKDRKAKTRGSLFGFKVT